MTSCRAVVFNGDGTWNRRDDFAIATAPPGGAVLAVEAVGLCHSDVAQLNGHPHVPGEVSPTVPGHEIVGRVHALDDGADLGVEVGDRVAVNIVTYGAPYEGNPFGVRCYGYSFGLDEREGLWGGYGEYMSILPGTQLVRLNDDISAEELTLFEPLSNMVAWLAKVNLQAGQTIVIQGPGHMGLTCAAYAKSLGATVIVTGTDEDALRLEVAREVGADHAIDVTVDDPVEVVQDLTGGFGASVAVDLASAPSTPSLCFDLVHHLGQVVWAGLKDRAAVPVITDKAGSSTRAASRPARCWARSSASRTSTGPWRSCCAPPGPTPSGPCSSTLRRATRRDPPETPDGCARALRRRRRG